MCRLAALLSRLLQGLFWQAELQLATDPLLALVGSRSRRIRNLSLVLLTLRALGIRLAWHKGSRGSHIVWIGVQFTLRWREGILDNEIPDKLRRELLEKLTKWASGGLHLGCRDIQEGEMGRGGRVWGHHGPRSRSQSRPGIFGSTGDFLGSKGVGSSHTVQQGGPRHPIRLHRGVVLEKAASSTPALNLLAAEIALQLEHLRVDEVTLSHLPGKINALADWLSRPATRGGMPESLQEVKTAKPAIGYREKTSD